MKSVVVTLLLLITLVWFACVVDSVDTFPTVPTPSFETDTAWRRTTNGWESTESWVVMSEPLSHPLDDAQFIHPALVGILQLLISLGGLMFFAPRDALRTT